MHERRNATLQQGAGIWGRETPARQGSKAATTSNAERAFITYIGYRTMKLEA
jgi:hypothetical protein